MYREQGEKAYLLINLSNLVLGSILERHARGLLRRNMDEETKVGLGKVNEGLFWRRLVLLRCL